MIRTVTLMGVLLGLVGCYPVKQTYFMPTAPMGVTVPNDCQNQIGPRGTVNFKLGVMSISVMMKGEKGVGSLSWQRCSDFVRSSDMLRRPRLAA